MPYEKTAVVDWVAAAFNREWADQAEIGFHRQPVGCVIATDGGAVIGFACWDVTARGFFGPVGVASHARTRGLGAGLTHLALDEMRRAGYGYAIIGGAGAIDFYVKRFGAIEIPGSTPGIYRDRLARR